MTKKRLNQCNKNICIKIHQTGLQFTLDKKNIYSIDVFFLQKS